MPSTLPIRQIEAERSKISDSIKSYIDVIKTVQRALGYDAVRVKTLVNFESKMKFSLKP